ncbi:hypothetical protein GJ744_004264 [Endocarpon pusillum]|uniref:Uncharacterized protein n=1 Tax=Endocarpon pusillum TaxID=364733 RepID=A0A8H7A5S1_9EURO|nr:hypothetical protein GJ744_004264 [Endocarpon pusillum]
MLIVVFSCYQKPLFAKLSRSPQLTLHSSIFRGENSSGIRLNRIWHISRNETNQVLRESAVRDPIPSRPTMPKGAASGTALEPHARTEIKTRPFVPREKAQQPLPPQPRIPGNAKGISIVAMDVALYDAGSHDRYAARIVLVAVGNLPVQRVDAVHVRRAPYLGMWIRTRRSQHHGRLVLGIVTGGLDTGKAVELRWVKISVAKSASELTSPGLTLSRNTGDTSCSRQKMRLFQVLCRLFSRLLYQICCICHWCSWVDGWAAECFRHQVSTMTGLLPNITLDRSGCSAAPHNVDLTPWPETTYEYR